MMRGIGAGMVVAVMTRSSRSRTMRVAGRIATLDACADRDEILRLLGQHEFPSELELALSLALLRTFAVPSISTVLAEAKGFTDDPMKRYDDTSLLLNEVMEGGLDGERSRAATRRINEMHAGYDIHNDDMLFVLSTFVFDPARFVARHGWRRFTEHEEAAGWEFWRAVGKRMGIREIPIDREEFRAWSTRYADERIRPAATNEIIAEAALSPLLRFVPKPLHRVVWEAIWVLLDDDLTRVACDGAPPRPVVRATVLAVMDARRLVVRHLFRERRRPYVQSNRRRMTYPTGYEISELGTFPSPRRTSSARVRADVNRAT